MDYPIRSVTFGGFDRQDVVRYLENFSRSAEEEKQALREENDRLSARMEELEGENASLRGQLEEARNQAAALQADVEREAARAAELEAELEAVRGLEQENGRLREEAASLRRDAAAYARFREKVGSIECEARERADALEAGASEKMHRTMVQFQERYQELIRLIESTAGHVTGELRKVEVNLSQLPRAMDQADREFDDLSVRISQGEYVPEDCGADGLADAGDSPVDGGDSPVDGGDSPVDGGDSPAETGEAETGDSPEKIGEPEESVPEPVENPTAEESADNPTAEESTENPTAEESTENPTAEESPENPTAEESAANPSVEEPADAQTAEPDSRTGSLRDAIQAAAAAKAPEEAVKPVRTVRPVPRDGRSGLFGFGNRRR